MDRRWSLTGTIAFLCSALMLVLLFDSRENSAEVRLFPLFVGLTTLAMTGALFLADWIGPVRRFVDWVSGFELVDSAEVNAFMSSFAGKSAGDAPDAGRSRRGRALQMMGWTVAYVAAVTLVGFIIATPVFLLAFWIVQTRERPVVALALTAGAMILIHLLFVVVLKMPILKSLM